MLSAVGIPGNGLRRPSIGEIDETVRAKLGMTRGASKAQPAAFNRQIAMYLAQRLGGWSTIRIGKFYNGRDHSTVCYGIRRIEALRQSNGEVERLLTDLTEEIEQIRRSRARSLPVAVQRQMERTETVALTDATLDGLAERVARRIQAILLTRCDSTERRSRSADSAQEPDPEAGLPRDAYASSGPASASSRRTARSSLPIESARSSTTRCVTPSRSYSRVRREPCTSTCEPLGSVLA